MAVELFNCRKAFILTTILCTILSILASIIALLGDHWVRIRGPNSTTYYGLFRRCDCFPKCFCGTQNFPVHAALAFTGLCLGMVFNVVAFWTALMWSIDTFTSFVRTLLLYTTFAFALLAGICILIGNVMFATKDNKGLPPDQKYMLNWTYGVAVVAGILSWIPLIFTCCTRAAEK